MKLKMMKFKVTTLIVMKMNFKVILLKIMKLKN